MPDMKVTLTFTDAILGTAPGNAEVYQDFVASKAPPGEADGEVEMLPTDEEIEKGTTVFRRTPDDKPCLLAYQIKGFFKDACGMLRRVAETHSKKLKAYKKEIDGLIFVTPELIPIDSDHEIDDCERPLRAQTAQGDRVALARSESIAAGATITFSVSCLRPGLIPAVEEWLEYGKLRGLGQWRNSGKGRFTCAIE